MLWELISDRYLHFNIKLNQKSDYSKWVDNVNSESESEEDSEWIDWFKEFPEDREKYGTKKQQIIKEKNSRSAWPNSEEMYWPSYHEKQITNFEAVLKDIAIQQSKKSISLSDINQSAFQSSFMKLWNKPETQVVESKKREITPTDEDEDDDDEDETRNTNDESEDELVFDEDKNPPYLCPRQSISPITIQRRSVSPEIPLTIETGLKTTEEVFGYDIENPSGLNLLKYERYAKIAEIERKLSDISIKKSTKRLHLEDSYEFLPSFFTVDSVYETEVLGITEEATQIYENYCNLQNTFITKIN
uniref:Uncharacterized protein n=1 Tax=Panagrolaimus sp. JU765 TaxID=591449 RepID=A0AC34RCF0_9BILA